MQGPTDRETIHTGTCFSRAKHQSPLLYSSRYVTKIAVIRNFRFGFQQPHTILEFLFLKPDGVIKASWAAPYLFRIARVGKKLPRNPDLPLAQPELRTSLAAYITNIG